MNFVPSWRSGHPFLKRGRRRRRRLKPQVYLMLLVGAFLIFSHVYENWRWNEFRKMYWADEELIVYDGGGGSTRRRRSNQNENGSSPSVGTNQQEQAATSNPDAKWNPTKIVFTNRDVTLSEKLATDNHKKASGASFLRDSRQSNQFSDFVQWNDNDEDTNTNSGMTYEQAKEGREPLLEILQGLGLAQLTTKEVLQLPKWSQIQDLYGDKPIFVGMDTCLKFQMKVPPEKRYIGVAGSFNTGTTAFGLSLQQNCRFPNRNNTTANSNQQQQGVITNAHGMLSQVPWAKHKMAHERFNNSIDDTIPKENVLPVVLVRDPYYWMHSMCQQGYGVRWDHNNNKHCPNLVPNEYDLRRFAKKYAKLRETNGSVKSVPVSMGHSKESLVHWDSLVHYWNDWYSSYYHNTDNATTTPTNNETFPRLMIRFEDTLFHAKKVMKMVCACGGGIFSESEEDEEEEEPAAVNIGFVDGTAANKPRNGGGGSFRPLVDEAKFEHRHSQHNLISAMVKYGTDKRRYRNMTKDDLEFAQKHLDPELIQAFHYKLFQPT